MARPLALFAADLHVRNHDRIWTAPEYRDLTGDTAFALEQIVALVKQFKPKNVFLGGDNMEAKLQRSDAIDLMRSFLEDVLHISFVRYIDGQHDLSKPSLLRSICPRAVHIHGQTVKLDNGAILYGLDYTPVTQVAGALAMVPPCDILLTHQVWKEFMGQDRGEASMQSIPSCKMLLTGDYHHFQFGTQACASGLMQVLSPGPVCMQEISEAGPKYVFLISDDLGYQAMQLKTRLSFESRFDTVLGIDASLNFAKQAWEMAKDLPEAVRKPILRITYPLDQPEIYTKSKELLSQYYHLFFKPLEVVDTTIQGEDVRKRQDAVDGGMAGVIGAYYNDDPVAASIALRLASAVNIGEEVQLIYDELIQEKA